MKILRETMQQGDAFDERLAKNIEQINCFRRKQEIIRSTFEGKDIQKNQLY